MTLNQVSVLTHFWPNLQLIFRETFSNNSEIVYKKCLFCLFQLNCVPGNFSSVIVRADDFCFEGFRRLSILSDPNSQIFFEDDFENGSIVRLCYEYEQFFRFIMISCNWSNLSYFGSRSRGFGWDDFLKQISSKYIFRSIMYFLEDVSAEMNRNDAVNQFKNHFYFPVNHMPRNRSVSCDFILSSQSVLKTNWQIILLFYSMYFSFVKVTYLVRLRWCECVFFSRFLNK